MWTEWGKPRNTSKYSISIWFLDVHIYKIILMFFFAEIIFILFHLRVWKCRMYPSYWWRWNWWHSVDVRMLPEGIFGSPKGCHWLQSCNTCNKDKIIFRGGGMTYGDIPKTEALYITFNSRVNLESRLYRLLSFSSATHLCGQTIFGISDVDRNVEDL